MLYFKDALFSIANDLIDAKDTADHIKAFNYILKINQILNRYWNLKVYNPQDAITLSTKIRDDYKEEVKEIGKVPSNVGTYQPNTISTGLPPELDCLNTDKYIILYSVLLKKGEVSSFQECLK